MLRPSGSGQQIPNCQHNDRPHYCSDEPRTFICLIPANGGLNMVATKAPTTQQRCEDEP